MHDIHGSVKKNTHHFLEKAPSLLLSLMAYNEEMGTVELSEKLGIHQSTVSRFLSVLGSDGFLVQNPHTRKFTLGSSIIELGWTVDPFLNSNLTRVAMSYMFP